MSLSEKYGIAASIGLLIIVLIDNAVVMLMIALAGLAAGAFVVRAGDAKRVVFVAAIAFAAILGLAIYALLR